VGHSVEKVKTNRRRPRLPPRGTGASNNRRRDSRVISIVTAPRFVLCIQIQIIIIIFSRSRRRGTRDRPSSADVIATATTDNCNTAPLGIQHTKFVRNRRHTVAPAADPSHVFHSCQRFKEKNTGDRVGARP